MRELPWETVIADGASIAVRASGTNAELRNTQFVALKVKDAICDRLAETRGARPDVKPQQPDALVEVRLREEKASLSLDLSGRSLTRRAYLGDEAGEEAPSVVSQAATLLAAVGAAELFAEGTTFLDPVDVDSILAREAAEVREDRAPGLLRNDGVHGLDGVSEKAWDALLDGRTNARRAWRCLPPRRCVLPPGSWPASPRPFGPTTTPRPWLPGLPAWRFPRGAGRFSLRLRRFRGHGREVQGGAGGASSWPRALRDDDRVFDEPPRRPPLSPWPTPPGCRHSRQ
ncbi:MAG: THUMP domain-containing protein [Adlercreutzia equolifaciens]